MAIVKGLFDDSSSAPSSTKVVSGLFDEEKPSLVGKAVEYGTKLKRFLIDSPAAANREAIRTSPGLAVYGPFANTVAQMGFAGDKAREAGTRGFANPEESTPFQSEGLSTLNAALDKTDVSKMGYRSQLLARFLAGIPSSTAGVVNDFATSPGDIAIGMLTEGAIKGVGKIPYGSTTVGEIANKVPLSNLSRVLFRGELDAPNTSRALARMGMKVKKANGQKMISEFIKPTGKEVLQDVSKMASRTPAEVEQAFLTDLTPAPKINPTKQLVDKFDDEIGVIMGARSKAIQKYNQPISPDLVKQNAIRSLENGSPSVKGYGPGFKQATPDERLDIKLLVDQEHGQLGDSLDTISAQARKEYLQSETQNILKARAGGKDIDPNIAKRVKDAYRFALKQEIERAHPDIAKWNSKFDGLDKARTWAAKMHQDYQNQPSGFLRRLTSILGRPNVRGRVAAAIREIPEMGGSVRGDMKRIAKVQGEYRALAEKAKPGPEKVSIEYTPEESMRLLEDTTGLMRRLMPPEELKQLADRGGRTETKLLPNGQGFEMVSPEESASRLRLQRFRDEFMPKEDAGSKRSSMKYLSQKERSARSREGK